MAQALIATALGLFIALIALFGFNFFSRMQSHALDRMERLGSRLVDHIRLDQENAANAESPVRLVPQAKGGAAMKLRRARSYRSGRIEIIPMIDVMFFLLVTFMLASLAMQSLNSMTVNLPKGQAEAIKHQDPVTLTVTQDKKLFLDKTPVRSTACALTLKPHASRSVTRGWW